jgi:hypothetical protein
LINVAISASQVVHSLRSPREFVAQDPTDLVQNRIGDREFDPAMPGKVQQLLRLPTAAQRADDDVVGISRERTMRARMRQMALVAMVACVLAVVLNGMALAQSDAFIGIWKQNLAKSKYDPASLTPKTAITLKREVAGSNGYKLTTDGKNARVGASRQRSAIPIQCRPATLWSSRLLLRRVFCRVLRLVDGLVDLLSGLLNGALVRARTSSERDC